MMSRPLFYSLIALTLAACTDGTLLHSYKPLPKEGWDRHDTIRFEVPQVETDIEGTLFIGLRTTANIGYQDIVLAVEQRYDAPSAYQCDTIHYPLADAEGYALTSGVNFHQYETQHIPINLQKGQSCSISIHHLMRHEVMHGIKEVGIKVGKLNEKTRHS
jgi:gliding motility-associated lipoprotein GldH